MVYELNVHRTGNPDKTKGNSEGCFMDSSGYMGWTCTAWITIQQLNHPNSYTLAPIHLNTDKKASHKSNDLSEADYYDGLWQRKSTSIPAAGRYTSSLPPSREDWVLWGVLVYEFMHASTFRHKAF